MNDRRGRGETVPSAANEFHARDGSLASTAVACLWDATTIGEMLGRVCGLATDTGEFARAIVVTVRDGHLTAEAMHALEHPPSDALRRRLLATPAPLLAYTYEAELIRNAGSGRPATFAGLASALQQALELENCTIVPITVDGHAVALLVAEAGRPTDGDAVSALELIAHLAAGRFESLHLHARVKQLEGELRYAITTLEARLHELTSAPLRLDDAAPESIGFRGPTPLEIDGSDQYLLTAQEQELAEMLVAGRSNREIANSLHLSESTVKRVMSRVARKLGATSRADIAGSYLRLDGTRHTSNE